MTDETLASAIGVQSIALGSIALAAEGAGRFFDKPTELEFFPILAAWAFIGAFASWLVQWRVDTPWPNRFGKLLSGVFAGILFGLLGWWQDIPPALNMFLSGAAAYWSDMALMYVARQQYGSPPTGSVRSGTPPTAAVPPPTTIVVADVTIESPTKGETHG